MERDPRPRQILFVGQRNDGPSQMAEAFAATLLSLLGVMVGSAGLTPTRVQSWTVRMMAEVGLDITPQIAKPLEAFDPATISAAPS